jgi:hypothetical protein
MTMFRLSILYVLVFAVVACADEPSPSADPAESSAMSLSAPPAEPATDPQPPARPARAAPLRDIVAAFAAGIDHAPAAEDRQLDVMVPGPRAGDSPMPAVVAVHHAGSAASERFDIDLEGAYPDALELFDVLLGPGHTLTPAMVDCPPADDAVGAPKTTHYDLDGFGNRLRVKYTSEDYRRGSTRISIFSDWPAREADRCF